MSAETTPPLLRIVRGTPDDAELAALTAVIAALARPQAQDQAERPRSAWSDPATRLRAPLRPGPGAWRASAWPH